MKMTRMYEWRAAEFAADEMIRRERPARIAAAVLGAPLVIAAAAALVLLCAAM